MARDFKPMAERFLLYFRTFDGCFDRQTDYRRMESIKTAFIGYGYRGKQLFRLAQQIPFFRIVAVADPVMQPDEAPETMCYHDGEDDYLRMLDEQKPELVFVSSPWSCHVRHALACIQRHCQVALEIKGELYEHEYQPLMNAVEQANAKVYPLENTLFLRETQSVLRMVREGVLGELVSLRGGYRHDLRDMLLDDHGQVGHRDKTESVWRSRFYQTMNADIYPTHGFAPLYMMADIGRTDQLARLTSFASKAVGLHQKIKELGGDTRQPVTMGDIVSTLIETRNGMLISLTHDTTLPRPRSLDFEVQGSKGIWKGDERKIYIEEQGKPEEWEADEPYINKYETEYWKRWGKEALVRDTHHHGMDYVMLKALEADVKEEMKYPAQLADLAAWAAVSPLSQKSIAKRRSVAFEI